MYLAVSYVDRFLATCSELSTPKPGQTLHANFIDRSNLQLLGVTCLFIASKLEEIYPPNGADFANTTADTYSVQLIDSMERIVLQALQWRLQMHTPFAWAKLFVKLAASLAPQGVPSTPELARSREVTNTRLFPASLHFAQA
jgi:hypothetical protein